MPADLDRECRYWDPLPTFGYLAAVTSRIRLLTAILVLGYHHPLEIFKRYGTLDRISDGRLILGLGVGYLKEEFELLGASFEERNERGDDALRALRAGFGRRHPEYDGAFFRFSNVVVDPCAIQQDAPLWVGGRTRRSLRRAVALGDAWLPVDVTAVQVRAWLSELADTEEWQLRRQPLDVVPFARFDPIGAPAETSERLQAFRDAGATGVNVRLANESVEHHIEQIEAMTSCLALL
jgi:probable F420-dependent oxidoreductase